MASPCVQLRVYVRFRCPGIVQPKILEYAALDPALLLAGPSADIFAYDCSLESDAPHRRDAKA